MRKKLLVLSLLAAVTLSGQQRGVFLEDIDKTADACTNFFDYANGAWRKSHPIPSNMVRWSRRWEAGERSKDQLQVILEDLTKRRGELRKGSIEQQITDFYGACMDTKAINEAGVKPIAPLLADIDAIKSRAGLQPMIAKLHDLSVNVPFGVGGSPDNHNPSQNIARVFATGLGLPNRDYYVGTEKRMVETRAKYLEHVAKMFELAGYAKDDAVKAANTVFAFESRLATAHFTNVERRNPKLSDNKVKPAELQKMTPHINWESYFKRNNVSLVELNVDQPKFMAALEEELATTPLPAWKAYLKWHVINDAASQLSDPFVEEQFAFRGQYLGGAKEMKARSTRCVEATDSLLGDPLGQKYVERHFPPAAKARMEDMVKNLLAAMGDTIRGLDWMGPETKAQALEKLSTFNPKIGYPDIWRDYSTIEITPSSHFTNLVNATKFHIADDRSQIGKAVDRSRWGMTPPTSNAYYHPLMNEIVFPAGILQPPAFDMNATDAVNYGAIGVVIGHEISHGFDDQGSQYDAQGRLRNWWTEEDLKRFRERTACVVEQFEGYFIEPGIHHNGKLVLGESIGDLAGAKIAYLGLQKAQAKVPGQIVDGFTPDQQFFIAWGQFRGDELRPETQRQMVQNGPHPTGKYRVIGPLSNMPEFAKAFGCAEGAEMVRAKRCEVW
jgi:putative endopeptidase